jgi:hypothetical protein
VSAERAELLSFHRDRAGLLHVCATAQSWVAMSGAHEWVGERNLAKVDGGGSERFYRSADLK